VVYDTSTSTATRAAHYGSLLEGLRSLRIELRKKHGGYEDLRGSGYRSVISYVHGESVVLLSVRCSSWEFYLVAPVVYQAFYSQGSGSYTVIQGPTGGPTIVGSLYNS
jgi:hypothetical protein